jgi:hypothetical protein
MVIVSRFSLVIPFAQPCVSLLLLASFSSIIWFVKIADAKSIVSPPLNLPGLSTRDDTIPPSPPWVEPSAIPALPACMIPSPGCPYNSSIITSCSAEKCVMTFIGACMQTGTLVNKSCFCPALSNSTCQSCSSLKDRTLYLYWLNTTCGDVQGWHGLPQDWTKEVGQVSFLRVGNATLWEDPSSYLAYSQQSCSGSEDCNIVYEPDFYMPKVVNSSCPSFVNLAWAGNIYNATDAALVDPKSFSPNYTYDPANDYGIFLNRNSFCKIAYNFPPKGCDTGGENTALLLWAAKICYTSNYHAFPDNWAGSLVLMESGYVNRTSLATPGCVNPSGCLASLNATEDKCGSSRCTYDNATKTCISISQAVDISCFCKPSGLSMICHPE